MRLFYEFIEEFTKSEKQKQKRKSAIMNLVDEAQKALLQPHMYPSEELKLAVKKLKIRAEEPMKVAITGQFSSGKSTFLNALLAKNILPTGITPVTSKVNYIRYGEELSIMARYKDGREAVFGAEKIGDFTDQRSADTEDIDFLTIYAPLELLKDIVFVDTPGLNSQSFSDTAATEAVLKEVDGIIWLSLIDNAGKMSEAEVLERYMQGFKNKSLCVLNQKDKFTPEQIEQTRGYVQSALGKYFGAVVPISAKQAAEARANDANVVLENNLSDSLKLLKAQALKSEYKAMKAAFDEAYEHFAAKSSKISSKSQNSALLEESNIQAVLEFIYKEIAPLSIESKEFAITKDTKSLISALIEQQDKIISIYDELSSTLEQSGQRAKEQFAALKTRFEKRLGESFLRIGEIIDKIAAEILAHKTSEERTRYAKAKDTMFGRKEQFTAHKYRVSKINSDEVYKKLFFDDDLIGKMFKQYLKALEAIQDEVNLENEAVFKTLEENVIKWREPNEIRRKSAAVHSDIQFANLRKFASKSYENILKPFNDEIKASFAKISSEFRHVSSCVKFNYQNATEVVIAFLERRIERSAQLFEENPTQFSVYEPKLDEIKERLKTSFFIYELENMMGAQKSFVSRNYDRLSEEFAKIKDERISLINESKKEYVKLKNELISLLERV